MPWGEEDLVRAFVELRVEGRWGRIEEVVVDGLGGGSRQ